MIAVTARAQQLTCDDVEPLLSPCVDGELVEDDSSSVKAHVARCDKCRQRLLELQTLKTSLAAAGRTVALPEDLEARLHDDLHRAARPQRAMKVGLIAASVAAIAFVGATLSTTMSTMSTSSGTSRGTSAGAASASTSASASVVAAALQRHRADLPVDVASPDPRSVQEFLAQRLGHRLRVPRLETFGFGLQGGRVVDVEDRQAAQLMYAGGYGQRLSVVAVPDPDGVLAAKLLEGSATTASAAEGLSVRVLTNNGAVYTLVGDVDEQRLERVSHELTR